MNEKDFERIGQLIDSRLELMESRLNVRFEQIDARFDQVEARLGNLETFKSEIIAEFNHSLGIRPMRSWPTVQKRESSCRGLIPKP